MTQPTAPADRFPRSTPEERGVSSVVVLELVEQLQAALLRFTFGLSTAGDDTVVVEIARNVSFGTTSLARLEGTSEP